MEELLAIDNDNDKLLEAFKANIYSICHASRQPVCVWDSDGCILGFNRFFTEALGHGEEVVGTKWEESILRQNHGRSFEALIARLSEEEEVSTDTWMVTNDGREVYFDWKHIRVRNVASEKWIYMSYGRNMSEEANRKRIFMDLVMKDDLTMLRNRFAFEHDMIDMIKKQVPFTLYLLDMDDFSIINDCYGYLIGDAYLRKISQDLDGSSCTSAYRWTGDEIVIVAMDDVEGCCNVVEEIQNTVAKPRWIDGATITATCSVGSVRYPEDGDSLPELYQNMDIALNEAKKEGSNTYKAYDGSFKQDLIDSRLVIDRIDDALTLNQFELYFQPIFSTKSRGIRKMEVLLRWPGGPEVAGGIGKIIDIAESTGQIVDIDYWVLEETMAFLASGRPIDPKLIFSINISSQSFHTAGFMAYLRALTERYGVAPERIEIEITEYTLLKNLSTAEHLSVAIKEMGFRIAMDDFGTKYSSLNYLSRIPFDTLKIDRTYVQRLSENERDRKLVKDIIRMAHDLDMETVAEGIEIEQQLILLREMGCQYGQGYLISRPMPYEAIAHMMVQDKQKRFA